MAQQKRKVSKTLSKIDHAAITKKINAIPSICAEGKKAVANLLVEFGYRPEPTRQPKVGEIWAYYEPTPDAITHFLIAKIKGDSLYLIAFNNEESNVDHVSSIRRIEGEGNTFTFAYKDAADYADIYC